MGALIRAHDWAATPLGSPEDWPYGLKSLVGVMLGSNQPMFIAWGADRTLLYNDAYAEVLVRKHPAALGRDFIEVWHEIRADLLPIVGQAYAGKPVHMDDITLMMERRGYPEETHFSFSYTPVRDEGGAIAGFFCPCTEITGQVMAERRLAAETGRQRRLFEQAPGFVAVLTSPGHRFEFVNQAYRRLFGDRDFIGKTVREAFPELGGQGFFERLDQVYTSGERFVAHHLPIRLRRSPGAAAEERFLDFIYEPVRDEDGQVTGIFCEGHDVTEAHLARSAIDASNARYTSVLAAMSEGFVVLNEDYHVTEINAEGLRLDGRPASELLGKMHWEAFPGSVGTPVEAAYRRAMTERVPVELEHRYVNPADDHDVWLALRIYPVPGGVAAFYRDISERIRAEEARRRSEERLRTALGISTVGVLFWGKGFALTEANDAFLRMTGFSREEAIGLTWQELTPEEFHPESWRAVEQVTTLGEATPYEKQYFRKDGSRWWGLFAPRKVGDEVVEFVLDVTDRRKAEAALRRLNEELETRVMEAVAEREKTEAALRQSQKLEAVGQLTGGVAHDFNNLLTIIRSSVEFLRRPNLPEERRRRYIDAITDTVDRAAKLTGQLLAFARRQALKPEVFDVPNRIQAVTDMLRTIVGSRIRIEADIACEPCLVEADVVQFETALVNMAVNARDAMNGEGTLTVRVDALAEMPSIRGHGGSPGKFVAVSIGDTGSGIPAYQLGQIFEPFFTTKEVGKGTGLGLSQVYGFAKQSGGDVAVESELGRGTTFTLYLPKVERGVELDGAADRVDGDGPYENGRGCRVLVVEDNIEVGRFSTQLLQDLGYETTWAANAAEALKLLADDHARFDVVFSDVVMPGMSGVELGREVQKRFPALPVVLTSGYSHVLAEEGRHGFELLHKPYAVEDVSRVLRRVTREPVSSRQAGTDTTRTKEG
ncbi:PAS domain-containing protein [Microvirga zambiensis]|uniref:PAS domain-containing protein n=1 Tax=Microvirga zambiensis TaxID=1402137 RepID=UPI00191F1037|nr:PAS domain-containing protein [Microvirga zambiensis]